MNNPEFSTLYILELLGDCSEKEIESFAEDVVRIVKDGQVKAELAYIYLRNIEKITAIAKQNPVFDNIKTKFSD